MKIGWVRRCLVATAAAVCASTFAAAPANAIVGGHEVTDENSSYVVSVRANGHECGGTVLNPLTVLTAAHCVDQKSPAGLQIRYGSRQRSAGGTLVGVREIVRHPDFDATTKNHDLAIVHTSEPMLAISPLALPLPDAQLPSGDTVATYGWGATAEGGELSAKLRKVEMPVVSNDICTEKYSGFNDITGSMFCAGSDAGGTGFCAADDGGPVVHGRTLRGVASWSYGCGRANYPSVFASIDGDLPWITANLLV